MNISEQICSFEYAVRLKELGVKQDSLFYRFGMKNYQYVFCKQYEQYSEHVDLKIEDGFSAFTVAELGQLLPDNCYTQRDDAQIDKVWICHRIIDKDQEDVWLAEKEADARALMLIHLIEIGALKNE